MPSGGPRGQWGRMYITPLKQPRLSSVLENCRLDRHGKIYVHSPNGEFASNARVKYLYRALEKLHRDHRRFVDLSTSVLRFGKFAQKCFCFAAAILRAFFPHALSACMLLHGCRSVCISASLDQAMQRDASRFRSWSPARGPCLDFLEDPRC